MPIFIEFHYGEKEENFVYMGCFHFIKVQNVTLFHYTSMQNNKKLRKKYNEGNNERAK